MYIVPGLQLIAQKRNMGCWYASAQMVINWKRTQAQATLVDHPDRSFPAERLTCVGVVLAAYLAAGCTHSETEAGSRRDKETVNMKSLNIVPGKSIGSLELGMPVSQLPKGAAVSGSVGEFEGVHFELADGRVEDLWIEDLRTFNGEVVLQGKPVSRDVSLEELRRMLGNCQRVDAKGGVFFNCTGVTIGSDFEGKGEFIQLRLKPR